MELTSDVKRKVREFALEIITLSDLVCFEPCGIVSDERASYIQRLCADVHRMMTMWDTPESIAAFQEGIRTLSEFLVVEVGGPFPSEVDRAVCCFFWLS